MTIPFTQLAFYVGHVLELAGVIALGVPAALDLRRAAASRPLVGDLTAADLVAQEEAFLGARVGALVVRLGEKDAATEGHTRRVAMLAVQVGEALGLARGRLRGLALGGLLHDMGKLAVPGRGAAEARPARRRRVRGDPQAPAGRRAAAARASAASRPACCGSCSTTTSGSTARATRAG